MLFILNESGDVIPESDTLKWGRWMEQADRVVGKTDVSPTEHVSTVFIGVGHYWDNVARQDHFFETAIFVNGECDIKERYKTKEQAVFGHTKWVKSLILE